MRALVLLAGIVLGGMAPAFGFPVSGTVFADGNRDGIRNRGETGLAGVAISNGHRVVVTGADGSYEIESDGHPFVFVSLPKGYRCHDQFFAVPEAGRSADFALVEWAESNSDSIRFVHISDTHVMFERHDQFLLHPDLPPEDTVQTFIADIGDINRLDPKPAFVLATGDLVHMGNVTKQFDGYIEGAAHFAMPLFNVIGNHDAFDTAEADADGRKIPKNYHKYLGPDYYSFNVGAFHFVVLNYMRFSEPDQQHWIREDLAAAPHGSKIVFAFHHLPTRPQFEFLRSLGAVAVLTGHWHGNRVVESQGVLDLNTPPLRFGGIDRHARGFRIVELSPEEIGNELRLGGFREHAVVVSPQGDCAPNQQGSIPIVVNAYDSGWKIAGVECEVGSHTVALRKTGPWSWAGTLSPTHTGAGRQRLVAKIRAENGSRWEVESQFRILDREADEKQMPELRLKWASATGGYLAVSSPKAGEHGVVIGVDDDGSRTRCGVSLFARDGTRRWHFKTDSGVKNDVAVANGRVFAASVAGFLYALDEKTGGLLWKAELDNVARLRWEAGAPVVSNGVVYVGGLSYAAAFAEKSGERLWQAWQGITDWWPSHYPVPVVAEDRVFLNGYRGAIAVNKADGQVAWKLDGPINRAALGEGVFYAIRNQYLTAIGLTDGGIKWRSADRVGDTNSRPALSGNRIVVGTADGRVGAFSRADGASLWNFETAASLSSLQPYQRAGGDVNSSPTIHGEKVYVGASDGHVYVLSLSNGEKIGAWFFGVPIGSTPLIEGDTLYVGAYDGNLYAFHIRR